MPLGFLINGLRTALRAAYDEVLRPLQLTLAQVGALAELARCPGVSVAQLAQWKGVTPQSMAGHMASLEAAGLVDRRHTAGSGHMWDLRLTAAGTDALRRGLAAMCAIEDKLWGGIERADRERFMALLERHMAPVQAVRGPRH